ncbi:hypothetical protein H9P43_004347 [Blastocladiella emersonii ATCC 22665]|nr:hypothetical protein H9P43_004347 [Blastocladiella emersonii ATCC 22665]
MLAVGTALPGPRDEAIAKVVQALLDKGWRSAAACIASKHNVGGKYNHMHIEVRHPYTICNTIGYDVYYGDKPFNLELLGAAGGFKAKRDAQTHP